MARAAVARASESPVARAVANAATSAARMASTSPAAFATEAAASCSAASVLDPVVDTPSTVRMVGRTFGALRAQQGHGLPMTFDQGAVPVTGAVHGERCDRAVGDV